MKNIVVKTLFVVALAAVISACKKDDSCSVSFPVAAAFVNDWGESASVAFTVDNVKTATVSSVTNGWSAEVDLATLTLTVTAPESADAEDADTTSSVTLSVSSAGGATSTATLTAYLLDPTIDLSADGTSNCYVLTKPDSKYRFDATVKGEDGGRIATADVAVVWQSASSLIRYLTFEDGYADFYVGNDPDDSDEIRNGNALIAAYDDAGEIIWSWHLWFAKEDPRTEGTAEYYGSQTFMGRNLGAYTNSDGSTDKSEILASYGLYYQWGRKDPFLRPRYYDCSGNLSEQVYNGSNSEVKHLTEAVSAETGSVAYAVAHPTTFLTSSADYRYDWLTTADDSLWGDGKGKSLYDPCPKGWSVPAADAFANLDIADEEDSMELEAAKQLFGWNLTDIPTGAKYFYTGAGYRSYYDGVLSNINYKDDYPYTPVPWVGYYWTAGTIGNNASAMFFDLNTTRATINAFDARSPQYRANGMQIRCVKTEM